MTAAHNMSLSLSFNGRVLSKQTTVVFAHWFFNSSALEGISVFSDNVGSNSFFISFVSVDLPLPCVEFIMHIICEVSYINR